MDKELEEVRKTLDEAYNRRRAITHITFEDYTPTEEDLAKLKRQFLETTVNE